MPSRKYPGLSYPTRFLKSRGSVIRNIFLEYRTNKATHFARRNDCYALLARNKAKHKLNRLFLCSCFIVKVKRKTEKSPIFESLPFLY